MIKAILATILTAFWGYTFGYVATYYSVAKKSNHSLVAIQTKPKKIPTSVNYHFTRICNYKCGFCFHTAKTSHMEEIESAKKGLRLLKNAGMKKLNFAGGEPFTQPQFLGELVRFCKEELQLESVSIVSNGSLIEPNWFEQYGKYLDILAISCDSFDARVNKKIGRGAGNNDHIDITYRVKQYCDEFSIKFKLNSVINRYNWEEDMTAAIEYLNPSRWKCFQVLILEGENSKGKRDASEFTITDSQFEHFVEKHKKFKCLVPESNKKMQNSYLILDEYMRFLNCQEGKKEPSESILKAGVDKALEQAGFDEEMFVARGAIYDWSKKSATPNCGTNNNPLLDW